MRLLQMQRLALLLPCPYHPKQQSHYNWWIVPSLLNILCLFKVSSSSMGFLGSPEWCGLLFPALCLFNSLYTGLYFSAKMFYILWSPNHGLIQFLFLSVSWVPLKRPGLRTSVQGAGIFIAILLAGWNTSYFSRPGKPSQPSHHVCWTDTFSGLCFNLLHCLSHSDRVCSPSSYLISYLEGMYLI